MERGFKVDLSRAVPNLTHRFSSRVTTIDSHTGGEPTRLIVGGVGPLPGATVQDKRRYLMKHLDPIRLHLTREPRGHRDMVAALVTEPCSEEAGFGLIYMDARRYPFLCGHATIGAVTTLIETGVLKVQGDEMDVIVDTPSGPMAARATMSGGLVESVAIRSVPSFVYGENQVLEVPGLGNLSVDTVCVGGFFVMVSSDQVGLEIKPANGPRLVDLGMKIIDLANEQLEVRHPTRQEVTTVDVVEFYDRENPSAGRGRSLVVYGEAHMDRSPCGTGTTAKMTLLHHRGDLALNRLYMNSGPLGTTFEGRLVEETREGPFAAVIAEIRGSAYITGMHQFYIDSRDPFSEGFLI
jgi:proline racemase